MVHEVFRRFCEVLEGSLKITECFTKIPGFHVNLRRFYEVSRYFKKGSRWSHEVFRTALVNRGSAERLGFGYKILGFVLKIFEIDLPTVILSYQNLHLSTTVSSSNAE